MDLLEAYLANLAEQQQQPAGTAAAAAAAATPPQLCALLVGLGEMAERAQAQGGGTWRPRYTVLGPLMARVVQVRGRGCG